MTAAYESALPFSCIGFAEGFSLRIYSVHVHHNYACIAFTAHGHALVKRVVQDALFTARLYEVDGHSLMMVRESPCPCAQEFTSLIGDGSNQHIVTRTSSLSAFNHVSLRRLDKERMVPSITYRCALRACRRQYCARLQCASGSLARML